MKASLNLEAWKASIPWDNAQSEIVALRIGPPKNLHFPPIPFCYLFTYIIRDEGFNTWDQWACLPFGSAHQFLTGHTCTLIFSTEPLSDPATTTHRTVLWFVLTPRVVPFAAR